MLNLFKKKCNNCGKPLEGKGITKEGNSFCSGKCLAAYEKTHKKEAKETCEFC